MSIIELFWLQKSFVNVTSDLQRMPQLDDALQSTSSTLSIGFPEQVCSYSSKIFSPYAGPLSSDKNVPTYDECCIGIYCLRHDKILLAKLKSKGLYLPNFMIKPSDSWFDVAKSSIQFLFEMQKLSSKVILIRQQLFDVFRVQLPKKSPHYLTRVTFALSIEHELNGDCQSQPDDVYKWMSLEEMKQNEQLWGVEPIEVFKFIKELSRRKKSKSKDVLESISVPTMFYECSQQDAIQYLISMDSKFQKEKELLLSARFTTDEVQKIFNEYVIHCFPSQYMTYASFKMFMNKIGWVNEEEILYKMVFRSYTSSIDTQKPYQYLTFGELIVGLAAMEERADHRANCLHLRLRYIFHFYDSDEDGKLNLNELSQMVADIKRKPMQELNSNDMNSSSMAHQSSANDQDVVVDILRRVANTEISENVCVTLNQLIEASETEQNGLWIAEMTETLFRSNISTIDVASVKFDYKLLMDQMSPLKVQPALDRYDEPCEMCHYIHFNMCSHAIKTDEHGLIRGTIKFDVCPFYGDTPFLQELKITEKDFSLIITELHRLSLLAINAYTNRETIDASRPMKNKELIDNIRNILKLVKEVIKKEPLVVELNAPCFIIGDIWSNLSNLHALISSITRMAPFVNQANIVFMGNYVDPKSNLGIECIIYLFCFKILMPTRITLLRGKNEFRSTVAKSKIYRDCLDYFSLDIFNEIYDIFEVMPFVTVIDSRLFVSKSGIPLINQTIDKIKELNPVKKAPIKAIQSTDISNIVYVFLLLNFFPKYSILLL